LKARAFSSAWRVWSLGPDGEDSRAFGQQSGVDALALETGSSVQVIEVGTAVGENSRHSPIQERTPDRVVGSNDFARHPLALCKRNTALRFNTISL